MAKNREKLVIIGDGETAELAFDYFSRDYDFEIVGFSAEKDFIRNKTLFGLPVVPLENVEQHFSPKHHKAFVAVSYTQLNRVRAKLYKTAKTKSYTLCSYVSPKAFIAKNVELGDNCFVFENASLQYGVKLGCNVTVWSGCSVGHHSTVGDNCFLASQVAVSGFCEIGENCFLGVNSCTVPNVKIGADCVVGAGAVVISNAAPQKIYVGNPAKPLLNKNVESFISGNETL